MRLLPFAFLFLWWFYSTTSVQAQSKVGAEMQAAVDQYRQLLVLGDAASDPTRSKSDQEECTTLGLQLWHEHIQSLQQLENRLRQDPAALEAFVQAIEDTTAWWDADKLAFIELAEALDKDRPATAAGAALHRDMASLRQIRDLYAKEVAELFGALSTRGIPVRRQQWDAYMDFIHKAYSAEAILKAYPEKTGHDHQHSNTRGGSSSIFGYKLPPKTLVLTFDDGPHGHHTKAILEVLDEREVPAIFFQVGENIAAASPSPAGTAYTATSAAIHSKTISAAGSYWLGNHSESHQLLSKMDSIDIAAEIGGGYEALRATTGDRTVLFRPPYGGLSEEVRAVLEKWNTRPYLWNIDSRDWADPIPQSIANRVVTQAREQGRGVILLHDIHQKTVDALPIMLDSLIADGFRFVLWDGTSIVDPSQLAQASRGTSGKATAATDTPYRQHWALVIGINEYEEWPKLQYAVNDARGIEHVLTEKLNFQKDHIITLLDQEATRQNIYATLEALFDPDKVAPGDAVFVFFAGHGTTRTLSASRNKGYIIPVDAQLQDYAAKAISMTEIQDFNDILPARHVFWVMDACYSGLALTRGAPPTSTSARYIREVTSRRGRQVLTAGGADEEVADGGPNGHSIFTWTLINALSGDADLNADNYITASELFNYVPPLVSSMSRQTPSYGSFVGSAGGDFVFTLKAEQELLSDNSDQHSPADMELRLEVERLRQELANMQQQINRSSEAAETSEVELTEAERVDRLNNQGLEFYRQQKYPEARKCFESATDLAPEDVQSLNNLGFIYYKEGNYTDAIQWIEKSLQLDPNRGVAYLNLADAQLALGQMTEAADNYEKYLSLMPENDFTRQLAEKVKVLRKDLKKSK